MAASFPILLVDDDPDMADILNRAAQNSFPEATFIAVSSFVEAATYLEGLRGRGPRLTILDLDLQSGRTGFDFLMLLRSHPQGRLVPVVLLSANREPAKAREAYKRGVSAFTVKPFNYEGWKSYVRQLRQYWFETVTTPVLWFEDESGEEEGF